MTNLEKFILELESQIKNGFIPNTGSKLKKLLEIIKVQNESLQEIFEYHQGKFGTPIYYAKQALEKVEQIAGRDE